MVFGHQLFLGFTWLRPVQKLILILLSNAPCHCAPCSPEGLACTQVSSWLHRDGLSLKGKGERMPVLTEFALEFNRGIFHPEQGELSSLITTSLVAQTIKNLPAMRETQVWSLGLEDSLEKGMATHSSILPEESHGQRSLAGYSPWGCKELDTTEWLTLSLFSKPAWACSVS